MNQILANIFSRLRGGSAQPPMPSTNAPGMNPLLLALLKQSQGPATGASFAPTSGDSEMQSAPSIGGLESGADHGGMSSLPPSLPLDPNSSANSPIMTAKQGEDTSIPATDPQDNTAGPLSGLKAMAQMAKAGQAGQGAPGQGSAGDISQAMNKMQQQPSQGAPMGGTAQPPQPPVPPRNMNLRFGGNPLKM